MTVQKQDNVVVYILQEKILDEKSLQKILTEQQTTGESLITILKKSSLINDEQLSKIIAATNKIEFVNLSPDMVDPIAAHMITHDIASKYKLIPFKKEDGKLFVAMSNPLNLTVKNQLEMRTGYKVVPVAATQSAIKNAIRFHFDVLNVTRQAIASMRLKQDTDENESQTLKIDQESLNFSDDPITKLVHSVINGAIEAKASDIHIEPQFSDMRVRYRIDGILRDAITIPASAQKEVISHIKIQSDMNISEKRIPQDGHISTTYDGHEYDLRVSSLPAIGGEKIVVRILDKDANKWSLNDIVTSPTDLATFKTMIKNPYGMILLTGPTGSGKTTTLYSVLQELNTPEKNIVTVEDPVEYRLDGITQVQIKPAAGLTFASSLRSILRQDPDIILIGEIRDIETAEIAVSAALTGHLVLSTLHTNDAAGAVSRLINLGIAPFLVASSLLGTVAQRLMRTVCPKCKEHYTASEQEMKQLLLEYDSDKKLELYKSCGCEGCYHTGFYGRKAIYEILPISRKIRRMITDKQSDEDVKNQAIIEGMKSLHKNGIDEVLNGATTFEELLRIVDMEEE